MKPAILALLMCAGVAQAQDSLPQFLMSAKLGSLDVRWVDFGWNPEAFTAMETGGKHPAAGREWMLAVLRVADPIRWEGRMLPVGPALIILIPKRGTAPMTLEIRQVDLRDMMFKPNVIGVPPEKGEKIVAAPANFDTVPETSERLSMALTEAGRDTLLTIRFGNRRAQLKLQARE
jgi:hypothetical protein